jgi:16S rRNA (uracil1498-N3)-methyltransferase
MNYELNFMALFYVPTLSAGNVLSEEESQHAVKVLRLQVGDEITVVDGTGGFYKANIINPHHKHCTFEITETISEYGKRDFHLHIAIAPTKNMERLEWFVEKATEIGIDEITPLVCRFSERKVIKAERLEKIIVSAAKQSVKAYFPVLNPLCTFEELMSKHQASQKFIAHCYTSPPAPLLKERGEDAQSLEESLTERRLLQNEIRKSSDVFILIGPEGDFSKEEVQKALSAGFIPVSLGSSRLRTETAGMVACHTVNLRNQE